MPDQERIGSRIAVLRKTRGWTARELAGRSHVSYSLLAKVESGAAPASPALIGAVARALKVDVPRITGQPYQETRGQGARLLETIEPIRRSVDTYDLPDESITPRPVAALSADVTRLSALGQSAKYVQIGTELPGLLDELTAAVHFAANTADQRRLFALLAEAYSGASAIANLLGFLDLRSQVVERISWASERSDDPLRVQRVRWQRSATLMSVSAYGQALRLMDRVRAEMGDDIHTMDGPTLSVYGSTHLRSAILAARAARTDAPGYAQDAWAHLDAARTVADRMGQDRNDYGLAFGPSNVAQHEVAVAVELEDGAEAVRRSRNVRLGARVPSVRRGHHYIDLARGYVMTGDQAGALRALQQARRVAPQQTRHHPMVRETILTIASARRGRGELSQFAHWLGVDT
ncbi:MAG: helix-turn-helix transcriptional regulator [Actinobacteria bacterium]|nr:helix-turn-helix transcriptional regulator [Actinomycetota bacterium]